MMANMLRVLAIFIVILGAQPALAGEEGDTIRVRGRVVDSAGKPIAKAAVTVPSTGGWDYRFERRPIAKTTSGDDGRFEIAFAKADVSPFTTGGGSSGADQWQTQQIVAFSEGLGVGFAQWNDVDDKGDLVLTLPPDDCPIEGRVLDLEGGPVAGVEVLIVGVGPADQAVLEKAYKEDRQSANRYSLGLPLLAAGRTEKIVSGADGRFRVTGMGRDRKVDLRLRGERIGYANCEVVTQNIAAKKRKAPQPMGAAPTFITHGAKFDYTATAGRTVRGVVTDAATKKPLAGVSVQSFRFAGTFQGFDPQGCISCVTGADGKYELKGFPKGKGNEIIAVPNDDQPYFMRQMKVEDEPGLAAQTIDVELSRGVFVTGKVTNLKTGEPIPARMMYTTYANNEHTFKIASFRREGGASVMDGYQSRYETKAGGEYRLVAAPGKAIIGVWCMIDRYRKGYGFDQIPIFKERNFVLQLYQPNPYREGTNAVKEVDVPVGAEHVACDIQLDPGESLKIAVIGPDGRAAKGPLQVRGNVPENYGGWYGTTIKTPTFEALGFSPGEVRTLFVLDDQRKIGYATFIKPASAINGKFTVQLQPMAEVKGRLLNEAGDPLAGTPMEVGASTPMQGGAGTPMQGGAGMTVRHIQSDKDGRFSAMVPPGVKYRIWIDAGAYAGKQVSAEVMAEPGSVRDVGDVQLQAMMMK